MFTPDFNYVLIDKLKTNNQKKEKNNELTGY